MSATQTSLLSDPRKKYPKPEYPSQSQSIPGEESDMKPLADHGESSYRGHERLKGLVAIVTGGDSGIGRAVALSFAREGADVVFTYLDEDEDARETERLVTEAGQRVKSHRVDQIDREVCDALIEDTLRDFGRIDILVNNAAFQKTYDSVDEIDDDEITRSYQVNVESCIFLARAVLPHMPPGGSIINTTSIQAYDPSPALLPYASTKAALANLTIGLSRAAAKQGVRVNAVAPGPVWTPLIPSTMPEEKVKNFGASTLWERPAQPAELAPVYVFLASEDASYITGEIYGVTGGRMQV